MSGKSVVYTDCDGSDSWIYVWRAYRHRYRTNSCLRHGTDSEQYKPENKIWTKTKGKVNNILCHTNGNGSSGVCLYLHP